MPRMNDHFDGARFRNPGQPPRRFGPILRWMLTQRKARWPRSLANPALPPPGPVPAGQVGITFIGHSTMLVRFGLPDGGVFSLLTDPVFSDRCSPLSWFGPRRVRAPGLALYALPHVDAVLLSHNHYDHMDLRSLGALQRRFGPRMVTTLGNARTLAPTGAREVVELDWWDRVDIGPVRITATPARHFSSRTAFDRDLTLWAGFMLELDGGRVLFAGDSGAGPHWRTIRERLGRPHVALLPIGAYLPRSIMQPVHMDPAEAVMAHRAVGARRSIGMHFGTFAGLTDEPIEEPEAKLAEAKAAQGVGDAEFVTLPFGATMEVTTGE